MPKEETLRIRDFPAEVTPEEDADAVVVNLSAEQLRQIIDVTKPAPLYYLAIAFGQAVEKVVTPQPTYDQILQGILTTEQYEQTLKANRSGKTVKFAKVSSLKSPEITN